MQCGDGGLPLLQVKNFLRPGEDDRALAHGRRLRAAMGQVADAADGVVAAQQQVAKLAKPLGITISLPAPRDSILVDRRWFYDFSGIVVVRQLRMVISW